jgi:hypothetical protein
MQPEALDPRIVADLSRPEAHRGDASASAGVEHVQTHLSHVFLTGGRAYKLRKAAQLSFVDFGSRRERNADCLREVALNRRLAPDVYLGVAPVVPGAAGFEVGPIGEALAGADAAGDSPLEHCVVMRRLPGGRDALSLLGRGEIGPAEVDAAAHAIAAFHGRVSLGPAAFDAEAWQARVAKPIRDTLATLHDAGGAALAAGDVARLERDTGSRLAEAAPVLEARRREGRIVDGHGDLHLQHWWIERPGAAPLFVDCLEFDARLRHVDAASDVAFLSMDLAYRGRDDLAERFLARYAGERDDFGLYAVVDLFASHRATVRAAVAALASCDPEISDPQRAAAAASAERHLALALRALAPRPGACLVALCGTVGSGKSGAAQALFELGHGVLLSSDRTRKHRAGAPATARLATGLDRGAYAPERVAAVYRALREGAEWVLRSGRSALVDATHARRDERARLLELARRLDVPALLVETTCPPDVARDRLARRAREALDPSDAGPELLATSLARFEPPDEWPAADRLRVDTTAQDWRERLGDAFATWREPRGLPSARRG